MCGSSGAGEAAATAGADAMNTRIKGMFDALEKELDEELDRRDTG
jgi:hypothetical protein